MMMETLVVVAQHRNQYCGGRDKSQGSSHYYGSSPSRGGIISDMNCRAYESGLLPTPFHACSTPKAHNKALPFSKTSSTSSSSSSTTTICSKTEDTIKYLKKNAKSSPIPIFSKTEDTTKYMKKTAKSSSPMPIIGSSGVGKKERHAPSGSSSISLSEIWAAAVPTCSNSRISGSGGGVGMSLNNRSTGRKEWARCGNSFSERWAGPTYSNSPPPSCLPMPKFSVKPKRTVSLELPRPDHSDLYLPPTSKTAPASPTREANGCCSSAVSIFDDDSATKTLCRILNLDGCGDD